MTTMNRKGPAYERYAKIEIRVLPDVKARAKEAAKREGVTLAVFVERAIRCEIARIERGEDRRE